MYEQHLIQAGLTKEQAIIYEVLLKSGPLRATQISQKSADYNEKNPIKRGLVYKLLDQLLEMGLVEKEEEQGTVSVFKLAHPLKIQDLVKKKENEAKNAEIALENVLGSLVSDFNLISGKPGIQIFEGLEGIKKVLDDTLIRNTEKKILTFSDVAGYEKYLKEWNTNHYAPKRKKLGIYEKVIIPNNQKAIQYMNNYKANDITDILFIDHQLFPFSTEVNIYSNKISFVTFSENTHVGVIIDNSEIYNTLSSVFNFCWNMGKKYCANIQPEWIKKKD